MTEVFSTCFSHHNKGQVLSPDVIYEKFTHKAINFLNEINFPKNPASAGEVFDYCNSLLLKANKLRDTCPSSYWLVTGSTQNFSSVIVKAGLCAETRAEFLEAYRYSVRAFEEYVKWGKKLLKNNIMQPHDCTSSADKLKQINFND